MAYLVGNAGAAAVVRGRSAFGGRARPDAGPGLPFGTYDICVQLTRRVSGNNRTWHFDWNNVQNTDPAGKAYTGAFVSSAGSTGSCP